MARTISQSVGRLGGKNLYADVITIQQMLNQVPATQGGPAKPLGVDGSCGTNTINAIQVFQIKHFGWSGADGRVDPAGQTMAKLNTFDKTVVVPPTPPVAPPKPVLPTSSNFFMFHMSGKTTTNASAFDRFFLAIDMANNRLAVYYLKMKDATPGMVPAGNNWSGCGGKFVTKKPRRVDDLGVDTAWFSSQTNGVRQSKIVLFYAEGGLTIPWQHHLIGPGGLMSGGDGSTSIAGVLTLVELR